MHQSTGTQQEFDFASLPGAVAPGAEESFPQALASSLSDRIRSEGALLLEGIKVALAPEKLARIMELLSKEKPEDVSGTGTHFEKVSAVTLDGWGRPSPHIDGAPEIYEILTGQVMLDHYEALLGSSEVGVSVVQLNQYREGMHIGSHTDISQDPNYHMALIFHVEADEATERDFKYQGRDQQETIHPKAGQVVAIDGEIPHEVLSVRRTSGNEEGNPVLYRTLVVILTDLSRIPPRPAGWCPDMY